MFLVQTEFRFAFDKVQYRILLSVRKHKIRHQRTNLSWFAFLLHIRVFKETMDNFLSDAVQLTPYVRSHQGSCADPVLARTLQRSSISICLDAWLMVMIIPSSRRLPHVDS